jgi:endoglucanase
MKKVKRKLIVLLSCVSCVLTLVGCQKNNEIEEMNMDAEVEESMEEVTYENLFKNGDFTLGTGGWGVYMEQNGNGAVSSLNEEGVLSISNTGKVDYSVQLYYDGFEMKEGGVYQLSFDIKSTVPRKGSVRIQINGGDYHAYIEEQFDITTEMETYTLEFPMEFPSDPSPRFCLNLGTPEEEEEIEAHVITMDHFFLALIDDTNVVVDEEEENMPEINLNQIGYLTNDTKKAILRGDNLGETFQVMNEEGLVVFEGELTGPVENTSAAEVNYYADFSGLTEPGTYTIASGEANVSYPFIIADGLYDELMKSVVKMLYLQRCGMKLEEEFAGDFAHEACHITEATIYGTNDTKDVSGGWHDAGDYGRYVSPGAITIADLFLAYEDFTNVFNGEAGDAYGIPESGNGIPDILDEAKYELDWMLKMQDDATGGVYHKVTCKSFPGFVLPEDETEELVLSPISTTATGAFAAIMAKSSQIYKELDPDFSKQCLDAAVFAWSYLEQNENTGGFTNPSDIVTGEYGDTEDADERYWAAAELLQVTKEEKYATYIQQLLTEKTYQGFGWADVGTYANITSLQLEAGMLSDETIEKIKKSVVEEADKYLALSKTDGYGISLGNDYMWGSNMAVCNFARQMIFANEISPNEEYISAVKDHFHYLLGANPMAICYVSGFGTVSPENPHHRMSSVVGYAMPGMLIGGPDSGLHDPAAEQLLQDAPPAKCYIDNEQSYSTNEITIYWNSPLVYLLAEMINE